MTVTHERRIKDIGTAYPRRSYDDKENDIHARVSVLEVRINNTAEDIYTTQESQDKIIDRLDAHIIQSNIRDGQLQQTIGQITVAVTHLSGTVAETNTTLKEIAIMAANSNLAIVKWDVMLKTLAKIAAIAAIAVSAIWTVFTFVDARQSKAQEASQVK